MTVMSAGALTVSPAVKIDTDGPAHNPVLSPDGTTMLFSSDNHTGLKSLKLSTGEITVLDESHGAGFNPVFSTDGKQVYYRTASLIDGLMHRDVRKYDIENGTSKALSPMSRDNVDMKAVAGATDYVTAEYDHIVISKNGVTSDVRPLADAFSYLWASQSPDGSKIVFVEPFKGVFVADADGSNVVNIAKKGSFPAWASDNLIVFTVSHDDGYVILDSKLRVYDLLTEVTVDLTPADVKVGESCAASNGTVVYSTLDGDVYRIEIK